MQGGRRGGGRDGGWGRAGGSQSARGEAEWEAGKGLSRTPQPRLWIRIPKVTARPPPNRGGGRRGAAPAGPSVNRAESASQAVPGARCWELPELSCPVAGANRQGLRQLPRRHWASAQQGEALPAPPVTARTPSPESRCFCSLQPRRLTWGEKWSRRLWSPQAGLPPGHLAPHPVSSFLPRVSLYFFHHNLLMPPFVGFQLIDSFKVDPCPSVPNRKPSAVTTSPATPRPPGGHQGLGACWCVLCPEDCGLCPGHSRVITAPGP